MLDILFFIVAAKGRRRLMSTKLPVWVELNYTVENVDIDSYYLSLNDSKIALPDELHYHLDGLGITVKTVDNYITTKQTARRDLGELFCEKICDLLISYWDFTLGLPYLKFTGDTNRLDDVFKLRPVVVYCVNSENTVSDITQRYMDALPFLTRFTFLAYPEHHHFKVLSQEHMFVNNWLNAQQINAARVPMVKQLEKLNIAKVHSNWYPDEEQRTELLTAANAVITTFVIRKGLNMYIPDFMVVPVYHIRRFQRAQQILKTKYNPHFVMSLPLQFKKAEYTILFPIEKAVTRHNLHRR